MEFGNGLCVRITYFSDLSGYVSEYCILMASVCNYVRRTVYYLARVFLDSLDPYTGAACGWRNSYSLPCTTRSVLQSVVLQRQGREWTENTYLSELDMSFNCSHTLVSRRCY